jgi:hypothetical protein
VKYLLRLAAEEAKKPEPLCASAILLLHDASELILSVAVEHYNVGKKHIEFNQYFELLNNVIEPDALSHRDSMRRLNEARIGLKHHGTMPSRRDVIEFDAMVGYFSRDNLPKLFSVSLDDVSLADLVAAESVRACLRRADTAFAERDGEAVGCAIAEAFARLLLEYGVRKGATSGLQRDVRGFEQLVQRGTRTSSRALTRMAEAVDDLHEEVSLLRQGIETRKLTVFRALMPFVQIAMAGNATFATKGGATPPSLEALRFCYDFVVDSALRMEDVHADIADIAGERFLRSRFGAV